jgi:hypothetical protein
VAFPWGATDPVSVAEAKLTWWAPPVDTPGRGLAARAPDANAPAAIAARAASAANAGLAFPAAVKWVISPPARRLAAGRLPARSPSSFARVVYER